MDDERFEQVLERLLRTDSLAGTEAFREELLARCLAELDSDAEHGSEELYDADLELLAAAGDATPAYEHPSDVRQDGGQASRHTARQHLR